MKVDSQGQILDQNQLDRHFAVDQNQFSIHQYIYSAKPDTRCVIHLRTPYTLAVSSNRIIFHLKPLC